MFFQLNPFGAPRGPQSSPRPYAEKFVFFISGVLTIQCFDLHRSSFMKNTLKKKTQKFFILINFYAKIEYVADLDYSANANSEMRQVLYTFPGSHVPFEESQKGC